MPKILAIDTSNGACSAAFRDGDAPGPSRFEVMTRGHAERLMPMIDEVMAEAGIAPETLDLIAVTTGPGAFTGLRLGLAAARGLALALSAPCVGVTSTETLAAALDDIPADKVSGELIIALIDTKRGGFYLQLFDAAARALAPPEVAEADSLAACVAGAAGGPATACVVVGDGQAAGAAVLAEAGWSVRRAEITAPDARHVARLAASQWTPGATYAPPTPLYLRAPDAALPKDGGRIRR